MTREANPSRRLLWFTDLASLADYRVKLSIHLATLDRNLFPPPCNRGLKIPRKQYGEELLLPIPLIERYEWELNIYYLDEPSKKARST